MPHALRPLRFLATVGGAFFLLAFMPAQAQATGSLTGKIVDEDGKALAGAVIRIVGTMQGAVSSVDGSFLVLGVGSGTYEFRMSCFGTETETVSRTVWVDNKTDIGTHSLQPAPPPEVVTVGPCAAVYRSLGWTRFNGVRTTRTISPEDLDRLPGN